MAIKEELYLYIYIYQTCFSFAWTKHALESNEKSLAVIQLWN